MSFDSDPFPYFIVGFCSKVLKYPVMKFVNQKLGLNSTTRVVSIALLTPCSLF